MCKSLFSRLSGGNNPEGKRFRRRMAKFLHTRQIKYVSTRDDDGSETVLGKNGEIYVRGDQISVVTANSGIVFRGAIDETSMSELLSLNGVVFRGNDLEHGGDERTVIAYYTYY